MKIDISDRDFNFPEFCGLLDALTKTVWETSSESMVDEVFVSQDTYKILDSAFPSRLLSQKYQSAFITLRITPKPAALPI